jgi:hypothetical protein
MGTLSQTAAERNVLARNLVERDHEIVRGDLGSRDNAVVQGLQQCQPLLLGTTGDERDLQYNLLSKSARSADGSLAPTRHSPFRFSMSSALPAIATTWSHRSSIQMERPMRFPGLLGWRPGLATRIFNCSMTSCRHSQPSLKSKACGGSPPTCCIPMRGESQESSEGPNPTR